MLYLRIHVTIWWDWWTLAPYWKQKKKISRPFNFLIFSGLESYTISLTPLKSWTPYIDFKTKSNFLLLSTYGIFSGKKLSKILLAEWLMLKLTLVPVHFIDQTDKTSMATNSLSLKMEERRVTISKIISAR